MNLEDMVQALGEWHEGLAIEGSVEFEVSDNVDSLTFMQVK